MKDSESPTLNAWREAWLYLNTLMRGNKIPNFIKYSIGEDVLRDMLQVGKRIDRAHRLINSKPYKSKQLVLEASELYDDVKFEVNQIIDAGYLPSESADNGGKIMPDRSREHLSKLMDNFGRWLGGWLKNIQSAGNG